MATFMRKIGCSYDTASNGLIALEKYTSSSRKFDFVLMGMPQFFLYPSAHCLILLSRLIDAYNGWSRLNKRDTQI